MNDENSEKIKLEKNDEIGANESVEAEEISAADEREISADS